VINAWKSGVDFVKVFPCGNVGGPSYIKSLKAALPQIPMVPTGGVNLTTAAAFLEAGSAALGIGNDLISAAALKSGDFDLITNLARQYVAIVNAAREPAHA
jgi:2-dehydro-3-deoxyphosphogluconate aldolase/(4S)-4-hydroxy-2-oxoglutarate aldolase